MVQGLLFEFRGLRLRVEGCMEEWKSRWQLLGFVGVMGIYREGCGSFCFWGFGLRLLDHGFRFRDQGIGFKV